MGKLTLMNQLCCHPYRTLAFQYNIHTQTRNQYIIATSAPCSEGAIRHRAWFCRGIQVILYIDKTKEKCKTIYLPSLELRKTHRNHIPPT